MSDVRPQGGIATGTAAADGRQFLCAVDAARPDFDVTLASVSLLAPCGIALIMLLVLFAGRRPPPRRARP